MTQAVPRAAADRMSRRRSRVLGALGVAAVSTLVAAVVHAAAGGSWPTPLVLAAALPVSVFLALPLLGGRAGSPRIAVAVLLDQAVFHTLFSTIGQAAPGGGAPAAGHAGHAVALPFAATPGPGAGLGAAIPDPAMAAGHLAAAVASFALLRGGWQLILRAVARGARLLLRLLRVPGAPAPLPARRPAPAPAATAALRPVVLRHALSRRGPPRPAPLG